MESNVLLFKKSGTDECKTPKEAIIPIIKYVPKNKIIWCPFDKENSEFVIQFKKHGYKVEFSHIDNGQNFFTYEPKKWDIMISNPPFSNKRITFNKAFKLNKPFALMMTLTWLNDGAPKILYKQYNCDMELLMFEERIDFNNLGKTTFSTAYFCNKLLPKQIILENLWKK